MRDNAGEAYIKFVSKNAVPKTMTFEEIQTAAQQDPQFQKLKMAVETNKWKDPDLSCFARFKDHRIVVPPSLRQKVVDIAHRTHQGIIKTKQLIREKVWFPGIDKVVEETSKKCIPCQASYPGHSQREPLCLTPLPSEPWSENAVDFAAHFPLVTTC